MPRMKNWRGLADSVCVLQTWKTWGLCPPKHCKLPALTALPPSTPEKHTDRNPSVLTTDPDISMVVYKH